MAKQRITPVWKCDVLLPYSNTASNTRFVERIAQERGFWFLNGEMHFLNNIFCNEENRCFYGTKDVQENEKSEKGKENP